MITMLVDHFVKMILFQYTQISRISLGIELMLILGRIAYPIFCFLLVEGFVHTRNRKRYLMNLLGFALITEIPFNLLISGSWQFPYYQNILWTFSVAVIVLMGFEYCLSKRQWPYTLLAAVIVLAGCLVAYLGLVDYGYTAILTIVALYYFHDRPIYGLLVGIFINGDSLFASLGFLLCAFYNGQRGHLNKWIGYSFYPLHLLLLYFLQLYLFG